MSTAPPSSTACSCAAPTAPTCWCRGAPLFAIGLIGAALLAASILPLSTAYSVCEAAQHPAGLDQRPGQAPLFYGTFAVAMATAAAVVLVPGMPLISVLYLTQALNAVLLLALLPFMRALARDPAVLGEHRLGRVDSAVTAAVIVAIAAACVVLLVLTIAG